MMKNDQADERSERVLRSDARKGNESVKFAVFYREYVMQVDSSATVAEVRAAYEKEQS